MNKNVKLLSMMLSLIMCLSAFTAIFSTGAVAADCTHENVESFRQEPTCTEPGGDMYRCEDCKEIYAENVVPALGHKLSEKTCSADQKCSVCGYEVKDSKLDHTWTKDKDGKVIVYKEKANCAEGAAEYTYTLCSVCGYKKVANGDPNTGKHVLVADEKNVVAPTCTSTGIMPYYCKNCDYTENVVIHALGHDAGILDAAAIVAKVNKTCTTDGMEAHRYCSTCKVYFEADLKDGKLVETTKAALTIPKSHDAEEVSRVKGDCKVGGVDYVTYKCTSCDIAPWVENVGVVHNNIPTNKTEPTCDKFGYIYFVCEDCGYLDLSKTEVLDPLVHTFYDKNGKLIDSKKGQTVPQSCATGEYTEYNCDKCGVVKVYNPDKPQLVHKFNDKPDEGYEGKAATCTTNGKTARYTCTLCKGACDGGKVGDETILALGHKLNGADQYKVVTVAPTCSSKGYDVSKCQLCGDEKADTKTKFTDPVADAHNMATETRPATCTEDGSITTYCKECHAVDTIVKIPATGHAYTKHEPTKDVAGTCQQVAKTAYSCTNVNNGVVCGEVAYEKGAKDTTPAGHVAAMNAAGTTPAKLNVLRKGTCRVKELVLFQCTECLVKYEDNTDYGSDEHHIVANTVVRNADCTIEFTGWNADGKYCADCSTFTDEATAKYDEFVWVVEPTRNEYKHDDKVEIKKQDATCTEAGWNAFKACSVCGTNGAHGTETLKNHKDYAIAAKGHTGTDTVVGAKTSNCTEGGNIAYRHCSVCDKYFAKDLVDAKKSALDPDNLTEIAKVDVFQTANGHNHTSTPKFADLSLKTCDQMSYTYNECACGDKYIDKFVNVKAHTWTVDYVEAPDCVEEGHTYYKCSLCTDTDTDVKKGDHKAALGHINAKGEIFFGKCNEKIADRQCVRDLDGDKKADCNVKFDESNEIHDYIHEKTVYATCDAYGYEMFLCVNCNDQKITSYTPATGHSETGVEDPKKQVPATHTTTGLKVWTCSHVDANTGKPCGADVSKVLPVIPGLNITIVADNAIANGYELVNGGKVQFTVSLETIDLMATSLLTTFTYDAMVLEFESAEIVDIFGEGTYNDYHANVVVEKTGNVVTAKNGTLILSSYADYTAEGKVQDVKISGKTAYAVLTFKINKDAVGENAVLTATEIELLNIKGEKPVATVVDDTETDVIDVSSAPVVIEQLGNVNGGADINSIDTVAIRKMFKGEYLDDAGKQIFYNAKADVDMDGDVDLEDFAELNKYLIGAISYADLVEKNIK